MFALGRNESVGGRRSAGALTSPFVNEHCAFDVHQFVQAVNTCLEQLCDAWNVTVQRKGTPRQARLALVLRGILDVLLDVAPLGHGL